MVAFPTATSPYRSFELSTSDMTKGWPVCHNPAKIAFDSAIHAAVPYQSIMTAEVQPVNTSYLLIPRHPPNSSKHDRDHSNVVVATCDIPLPRPVTNNRYRNWTSLHLSIAQHALYEQAPVQDALFSSGQPYDPALSMLLGLWSKAADEATLFPKIHQSHLEKANNRT